MLSASSASSITQHTNEISAPRSIRSASSLSGTFPTVQHNRATSLDLESASHSLSASPSTSSLAYPRSSILINSRKRPYKGVIYGNPPSAAPVVTHIPAVPSRKEREKEKERIREKEREREREKARNKDDETFWGIPKKAFLLGLGDLNFNAQMSMVAGWSHTSSSTSLPPVYPTTTVDRKRARTSLSSEPPRSAPASISSQRSTHDSSDSEDDTAAKPRSSLSLRRKRSNASATSADAKKTDNSTDSTPADEPMDPEELAALNAIINTRRSMAAAQALVSGTIAVPSHPLRGSSFGSSSQDVSRPQLDGKRFESQDSVPSMGHSSVMSVGSSELPTSPQPHGLVAASASTVLESPDIKSPRIRFAPLPTPSTTPATLAAGGATPNTLVEQFDDSDASDSDYESEDDTKSMKGKWYLMGMSPALFKPQSYTTKTGRRRKSNGSLSGHGEPDDGSTTDLNAILGLRRRSTGLQIEGASTDAAQRAASENNEDERGRATGSVKNRRKSLQSTRRSRSRTGAISSGDEDERARKRELIRLARPGGTGMVTLPDGTKIRARRVNDQPSQDEPEFIEWGFAGLAREASRRSLSGSGPPSLATTPNSSEHKGLAAYMEAEEDEEDDGSGMAWVRRRRREREAKARMEREQAEKAAQEAANAPAPVEATTQDSDAAQSTIALQAMSDTAANSTDTVVESTETAAPIADEPMQLSETMAQLDNEAMSQHTPLAGPSRRSTLTPMDISRIDAMSEQTEPLVSSPVAEHPPAASLDAPVLGDGEPVDALEGSQRPARSRSVSEAHAAGDSTPRQNTGLGLTADKLEEIRRRHEDEVAALGAEVLAQTRRNQRRQASSSGRPLTTPMTGEESGNEHAPTSPARHTRTSQPPTPIMASSSMLTKSASRDSAYEKRSLSRAVGSTMRKNMMDGEKPVRHSNIAPFVSSDERRKRHEAWPSHAEPVETKPHVEAVPVVAAASASGSAPRVVSNPLTIRTSIDSQRSSKSSTVGYSTSMASKSVASLQSGGGSNTHSPIGTKRISLDPSVSTPAPSPWLPRRPDARGVSVVPLPQLGVRPERPREGRVWQYDDSDPSEGSKSDEEGSDLDAEELLEEERKTAMQKKRATTRAAGQEIVHARLGQKASARALSDLTASYDDMALSTMSRQQKADEHRAGRPKRRSTVDPRISANSHRSPSAPQKAPPKLVRSSKSTSSVRSAEDEAEDEEEDLWPAMSATSKSGTPRPRHILVNLPGGPGIWDSKTGGGRNAVAAINTVAAARAKAIKKRAKDRRTSFELPPNWDDEMMDYGWPRSLKGSLY